MTSQTFESPVQRAAAFSGPAVEHLTIEQRESVERLKRLYKADHQAEYLYIQAEVDSLWIQLEQAKALNKAAV